MNHTSFIIVLALLGLVGFQKLHKQKLGAAPADKWWTKLLTLVAFVCAILIIINPEFLALGFLGDTAFFDLLVLLLTLQLQMVGAQIRTFVSGLCSRVLSWFMAPRLSYLLVLSMFTGILSAFAAVHRFVQRIIS